MYELGAYLFAVALLLAWVLTPVAIHLGRCWGVLDHPGGRKIHRVPIPLSGGWAIFAALTVILWGHLGAALILRATGHAWSLPDLIQDYVEVSPALALKALLVWLGALVIFVLGVVDDVRGMAVRTRLACQGVVGIGLAALGLRPHLYFLPDWATVAIGVIWIVGITNAFNFLDGLDGLSAGVAFVSTTALMAIMVVGSQPLLGCYLAVLAGVQIGFLRYNFHPAKVFLGSSGALLLGYLMATSTILVTYMPSPGRNWLMPLLTPILILAIPVYDTASVVLIRLFQKRSIAVGDQSHFHHRLRRLGFSHRQSVLFIWLVAFSVGLSAVGLIGASFRRSILILLQVVGILSLVIIAERVALNVRRGILERARRDRRNPSAVLEQTVPSEADQNYPP